jgi:internalin A
MVEVQSLINDVLNPPEPNHPRSMKPNIFISYSHIDHEWLTKLQTHLKPLVRKQTIDAWDDKRIRPGQKWQSEIEQALAKATIAILLVSPNFLASDFIADQELPPLLKAAEDQGLTILWIPISASLVTETEINDYQAAHDPSEPLDSLSLADQNRVLVKICQEIKRLAADNESTQP